MLNTALAYWFQRSVASPAERFERVTARDDRNNSNTTPKDTYFPDRPLEKKIPTNSNRTSVHFVCIYHVYIELIRYVLILRRSGPDGRCFYCARPPPRSRSVLVPTISKKIIGTPQVPRYRSFTKCGCSRWLTRTTVSSASGMNATSLLGGQFFEQSWREFSCARKWRNKIINTYIIDILKYNRMVYQL